jgi:hypothetical protein
MEDKMRRLFLLVALLAALCFSLAAEQVNVGGYQNEIRLTDSNPNHMIMEMTLGHFNREAVQINGETWYDLNLKREGLTLEAGYPQVPVLARSVIIPNTARMELTTIGSEYVDLQMRVAPSKGNLTRDIDPDSVPYSFSDFYQGEGAYPAETSYLTEPFILRDYRGITVRFQPFVYLPASQTLRVFTRLQVEISNTGTDHTNSLPAAKSSYAAAFSDIYENMFLNFNDAKYPSLIEEGRILAIKNSMFDTVMQPWVEWKRQNGYTVDVVDVTVAGPTATQIQTYIQNQYNLNNGLMFVQIFGDAPQVPTLTSGGGGSDPSFALLAGGDSYPDIYVGRFSAQTVAEMQTQILRSVWYERDVTADGNWMQRGMGIASNEGGGSQGDMGESDQTHIENIRTDLLNFGYLSVDQMYQTQGATATQVGTNVNAGRGFINYCGHGASTYWVTTGFSNTDVNNLVNDYMLPFIVSVACVNGNFVSQTCFAEAWLRATNNTDGDPTGAIAMYASTINQGWNPPMRGQDEVTDLLVGEQKRTVGGLLFNGSSKMIEVYGTSGISEYKCWTIFGDASLMVRTKQAQALTAVYNPVLFMGMTSFEVLTAPAARVTLSANGTVYGFAVADAAGNAVLTLANPPAEPMDLTLTITAYNKVTHVATVQVLPSTGAYIIVNGIVVTDDNNNQPDFGETVTLNVNLNNVGTQAATNVVVSISTEDEYLTILNSTETIPDIAASGNGGTVNGFGIQIASDVPDQHVATIHITITTGREVYEYDRMLTINAPAFTWGGIMVEDFLGNSNGMIDPGETVTLSFPVTNTGHAQAAEIMTALVINNVTHVADPIQTNFAALPAGAEAEMIYSVTFSSQIPTGTLVNMSVMLFSGDYSAVHSYAVNIGLVIENFESNFTGFPWTFNGGNWTIDGTSYNGSSCARSATITHNQTTSMTVTMNSQTAGAISFWKKVSSEQNYDYLRFYINNVQRNQWSGTSDVWSQVSYDVQPGNNTFRWEYSKDSMVSSGSDCAWIDDILFPTTGGTSGTPNIALDVTTLDFEYVPVNETGTMDLVINNTGDAVLIGSVVVEAPFAVYQGNSAPSNTINIVVPAGSFLGISVNFNPTQEILYESDLLITTDDPDNPVTTVSLTGSGQIVANDDPVLPVITELKGNYPNPFNPRTTISYSLKESTPVRIDIFNLKGQLVKTLENDTKAAGSHSIVWNGEDQNDQPVSSGVFFYKMTAGKYTSTKKMIMLK